MVSGGENRKGMSLPSLVRGMYTRLARELGYNISYIIRVANGERKSVRVERALSKEVRRVLKMADRAKGAQKKSEARRYAAKKLKAKRFKRKRSA
jgi:hypothetical protein